MRCNHCDNAPCVEICPVTALYRREDGIVDFNNQRCIGCKACMQACPYDALYIDPETHTAAKCNYCAHRVDVGLEPACVNVCPTQAIISGDLDDPESRISQTKDRNQVTARKTEKGTVPALFYINGDVDSLDPLSAPATDETMWGTQVAGVGHWAADHEPHALDRLGSLLDLGDSTAMLAEPEAKRRQEELLDAVRPDAKRAYDAPQKGVLWGWQVSGYLWTKSVSAGACLLPLIAKTFGIAEVPVWLETFGYVTALLFLAITGILLMWDLDQPKRFLYVLLRPQWKSWLVKGAYIITGFGGLLTACLLMNLFGGASAVLVQTAGIALLVFAVLAAIYTAFLFAQAKGRDFWQSPVLPIHMLTHSVAAGAACFLLISPMVESGEWLSFAKATFVIAIGIHLACDVFELFSTHPTENGKRTAHSISHGRYRNLFWFGSVLIGGVVPVALLLMGNVMLPVAGVLALVGIFVGQHIWVRAPQQIPLS